MFNVTRDTEKVMTRRLFSPRSAMAFVFSAFVNSALSPSASPICLTAVLKACSALDPERICCSMSSRRWLSSSSSGTGVLMPAATICRRHSVIAVSRLNIVVSPQAGQDRVDCHPLFALFVQRAFAVLLERVILPLSSVLHFHPAGFDPAIALHSMQHGVKHPVRPLDVVPVASLDRSEE